jgi:aminoglycoside phosphotransferase family enzyme
VFDAIEFDEAIATCDVLYDLAFLLMDLWTRGLRSHANLLFNRYLWICDDVERQLKSLSLLPLFLSLRAAIRAKVTILQPGSGDDHAKDARRHFEAACGLLAPRRLDLVCRRRPVRDRQELGCHRARRLGRTPAGRSASAERH